MKITKQEKAPELQHGQENMRSFSREGREHVNNSHNAIGPDALNGPTKDGRTTGVGVLAAVTLKDGRRSSERELSLGAEMTKGLQ